MVHTRSHVHRENQAKQSVADRFTETMIMLALLTITERVILTKMMEKRWDLWREIMRGSE